jgi:hypothetical protein
VTGVAIKAAIKCRDRRFDRRSCSIRPAIISVLKNFSLKLINVRAKNEKP